MKTLQEIKDEVCTELSEEDGWFPHFKDNMFTETDSKLIDAIAKAYCEQHLREAADYFTEVIDSYVKRRDGYEPDSEYFAGYDLVIGALETRKKKILSLIPEMK